jgi:hypothetical protein
MDLNHNTVSEYRDCQSNVHRVTHTTKSSAYSKEELENIIVEELYRIFTKSKNI